MKFTTLITLWTLFNHENCLCAKYNLSANYDSEKMPKNPMKMNSEFVIHAVTSMDTNSRTFGLDVTLRQKWNDSRIRLRNVKTKLNPKKEMDIWIPEYFVYQATDKRRTHVTIELSNTSGTVTVEKTTHYNVDVGCSMNFTDFPYDKQDCYLALYTNDFTDTEIKMTTKVDFAKSPKFLKSSGWNVTIESADFTPYTNLSTTGKSELLLIEIF